MGHYANLSVKEARRILGQYGAFQVQGLIPLNLGISNSNYKVQTDQGRLFLKVSGDKKLDQLKKEMEFLKFLKEASFPFSLAPFPLKDGSLIFQDPPFFGAVFPFVEGLAPQIGPSTCAEIGRALAHLHRVPPQGPSYHGLRHHSEVGFELKAIWEYVDHNPSCPADFREMFYGVFPEGPSAYAQESFQEGPIHGDLYYDNTLFQGEGFLTMLDFEQAGRGPLLFDLGVSVSGTCLREGALDRDLLEAYMKGYESVRPLPVQEKRFLQEAVCLGFFSIALWRIKRFREGKLDPQKADSYRELLDKAVEYRRSLK